MSSELIAIIAAAIALAGLNLVTTERLDARITSVEERLAAVQQETARISGLLEGLGLSDRLSRKPDTGDTGA